MLRSQKLPLLVRALLVHLAGAAAGVAIGFASWPATGELADAVRPYLIAVAGTVGLVVSGIVTAWLCSRDG